MFKKLMGMMIGAALMGVVAVSAQAAQNVNGYIVLRCTVTLSVTTVGAEGQYSFGDVSANQVYYSTSPITFRNDSTGAICKWDLNVQDASLGLWTLSNEPGLNQVAIAGLFKTTVPGTGEFDNNLDSMSVTAKEYNSTNYRDEVNGDTYRTAGLNDDCSKIVPYNYSPAGSDRKLWLKLQTPLAVTDEDARTITLIVTAKMAAE